MSYTNAQIVLNSRDRQNSTPSNYNDAQYNAQSSGGGQNIIQGEIREIAVSEVNFPYDIPNIQSGYNTFLLQKYDLPMVNGLGSSPGSLTITIAPGFYTGGELATAINAAINAQQIVVGDTSGNAPTVTYTQSSNLFAFIAPNNPPPGNPTPSWAIFSPYTFPYQYNGSKNSLGKDILSIMGYLPYQAGTPTTLTLNRVSATPAEAARFGTFVGNSAPLAFTQYVDICSDKLTSNQMFQGGSTTNLARRQNVICRMFICDNVSLSTPDPEGSRPFILNRQYVNARVMKWTTESSIPTIDIQLYDDCGQLLQTTWQPRNYAITFNAYEQGQGSEHGHSENIADYVGGDAGAPTGKKYRAYQEQNVSKAWAQLAKQ